MIALCKGDVHAGDQLVNALPTESNAEAAYTVEKVERGSLIVTDGVRRGKLMFRSLTDIQWEERFY